MAGCDARVAGELRDERAGHRDVTRIEGTGEAAVADLADAQRGDGVGGCAQPGVGEE